MNDSEVSFEKTAKQLRARIVELESQVEDLRRYRIDDRFFENSNDFLCIADLDGTFKRINPTFTLKLGYSESEILARPIIDSVHPDDRESTIMALRKLSEGESVPHFENRYRSKDGSYRWLSWMAPALQPGSKAIFAVARDITDQKATLEALKRSQDRLDLVLLTTQEAIWDYDVVADSVWLSERYQRLFGTAPATSGVWDWWVDQIYPDDRARVSESLRKALTGGQEYGCVWQAEYRFRSLEDGYLNMESTGYITRDENGKATRIVGTKRDLTERKTLERRLLDIADEEQKRIAHDLHDGLGQELTGLAMMAEALSIELREKSLPESKTAKKIAHLLDGSLRSVRGMAQGLRPVEIDSHGLESNGLAAALERLALQTAQMHRVQCKFDATDSIPNRGSEVATQLYRIVQEAVTNAAKHGKPNVIEIKLGKKNEEMELFVSDDGVGMVENSNSTGGIGMRSMHYRCSLIGARLSIESKPDGGTVVACRLPL